MSNTNSITADHYSATTQAVRDAIDASIRENRIPTIECLSDDTFGAVKRELLAECEGEDGETYWGVALDDEGEARDDWRVRVVRG